MSGVEPRTSGIESNRSTNFPTFLTPTIGQWSGFEVQILPTKVRNEKAYFKPKTYSLFKFRQYFCILCNISFVLPNN